MAKEAVEPICALRIATLSHFGEQGAPAIVIPGSATHHSPTLFGQSTSASRLTRGPAAGG